MLSYDHQWGWGGVLTSLTSTSLTLRNMYTLRMLSYDHQGGGGGGCISVLDEHFPYVTEHVALKTQQVYKIRYTWAYSWTWRQNAALLQSVASALPQALWHWSGEKRKKLEEWMSPWFDSDDWIIIDFQRFFWPLKSKIESPRRRMQIFTLESHACQSKGMSMLQTFFDDSCKYQHFVSYSQKSEFQIRHPYKGAESTGCLVFLSVYLHIIYICLPLYLFVYLSFCLSTHLPLYLSTSLPLYLSTYLPIYLSIYLAS